MKNKIKKSEDSLLIENINKGYYKKNKKGKIESVERNIKKFTNIIKDKNNYKYKGKGIYILIIVIIIQFILIINFFVRSRRNSSYDSSLMKYSTDDIINDSQEKIEEIDTNILFSIEDKLEGYIEMTKDERKFLNGLVRKYKPKKIVEIGVSGGGSSALILNAVKDIPEAKVYSIDRYDYWYKDRSKKSGWIVKEKFPELVDKWKMYVGNTAEFIETIGNNIDFAFIDTMHITPGEMLNWLEVLPFLKEEAIVAFHDTYIMYASYPYPKGISNYSNNQLLCYIRGQLILPTYGDKVFSRNIGALKLEKNQKQYYKQYFLALGTQWKYKPDDKDLEIMRGHFKKYYGDKLVEIYDDAVEKNKQRLE